MEIDMVRRSIEVKSIKLKASRPILKIKTMIKHDFGDQFTVNYRGGYVTVRGDLHDYRTRERLYSIITTDTIGG